MILSLTMLIQIAVPTAFADVRTVFGVGDVQTAVGEEVCVAVSVANNPKLAGFKLYMDYDNTMLTPVSIEKSDKLTGELNSNILEENADLSKLETVEVVWYDLNGSDYSGELFYVTFKVNKAAETRVPIKLRTNDVTDIDLKDVDAELVSGIVTVTDGKPIKHRVTVNDSVGGNVYTDKAEVEYGGNVTVTYSCGDGYVLNEIYYVSGAEKITIKPNNGVYIIENIISDISIYAVFEPAEKNVLGEKISLAREYLSNEKYTAESKENLQKAAETAQSIYDTSTDVQEIKNILNKLDEIINALEVKAYYIKVNCDNNIAVSPGKYVTAEYGDSKVYKLTPRNGYKISGVFINGEYTVLTDNTFTIDNITENYTVDVTSAAVRYSVKTQQTENGKITVSKGNCRYGEECTVTATAASGYIISDLIINGESMGACEEYTVIVTNDITVKAVFEKIVNLKNIMATAGIGGQISPIKSMVNSGGSAAFIITADYGYEIDYVSVNGVNKSADGSIFMLDNVTEDTAVEAVFKKKSFKVNIEHNDGGSAVLEYGGETGENIAVPYGDSVKVVIECKDRYELNSLYVNGVRVKPEKENGKIVYTFVIDKEGETVVKFVNIIVSSYNEKVAQNGVPSDVTADNAEEKKAVFTGFAEEYAFLDAEEKKACSGAYATVLDVLDRANAFILLKQTDIEAKIKALPTAENITDDNFDKYDTQIKDVQVLYESLTVMAKSLVEYELQVKLENILAKAEQIHVSRDKTEYFIELINSIPTQITEDNIVYVYNTIKTAETLYNSMTDEEKEKVSEETVRLLWEKLSNIIAKIRAWYITDFENKVRNLEKITVWDEVDEAERKRVNIYELMNTYDLFAGYIQEMVSQDVIDLLYEFYSNATVLINKEFDNGTIQIQGDVSEDVNINIQDSDKNLKNWEDRIYRALEITLEKNKQKIQPGSKLNIKVPIDADTAGRNPKVLYIDDNGNAYDVQPRTTYENGQTYINWKTDHFSCFAIVYDKAEEETNDELVFDKDSIPPTGGEVTVTVGDNVDITDCTLWIAGYNAKHELMFVNKSDKRTNTVAVTENTAAIKAMLWKDECTPMKYSCITK